MLTREMICWIDKWIWASYLAKFKTPFSLVVFIFEHGPWASMYWIICLPTPKRWETDYFSFFSTLNVELRTRSFCWNAHKSSVCMVWVFFFIRCCFVSSVRKEYRALRCACNFLHAFRFRLKIASIFSHSPSKSIDCGQQPNECGWTYNIFYLVKFYGHG